MQKDDFWQTASKPAQSFARVSDIIRAAASREEIAHAEAETQAAAALQAERKLVEAQQNPQERQCKKCGKMTIDPCA